MVTSATPAPLQRSSKAWKANEPNLGFDAGVLTRVAAALQRIRAVVSLRTPPRCQRQLGARGRLPRGQSSPGTGPESAQEHRSRRVG